MSLIAPLPYTIANGQIESAVPVQANYQWIVDQINFLTHVCIIGGAGVALSNGVAQPLCTAATSAAIISDVNNEFDIPSGTFTPKKAGNYNFLLTIGLVSTGVTYLSDSNGAITKNGGGSSTLCTFAGPLSSPPRLVPLVPYKQTEFAAIIGDTFTFKVTSFFSGGTPTIENYQLLITRVT